jgi:hypothetical protein
VKCQKVKPLGEFNNWKRSKDGKKPRCRQCRKDEHEVNKEHDLALMAAYRAGRTPEQKAEVAVYMAQYYRDHPEKWVLHAQRRLDNSTPEERNAYWAKYYAEHKEQSKAHTIAWRLAHPKERQAEEERRRARKANAEVNDLTHEQWLEIQEAQNHRCYYCGKRCKGHLTQDHLTPFSKNGSHTLHNVIGACGFCNSKKGKRKPPIPVQPFLLTIAPAKQHKPRKKKPKES